MALPESKTSVPTKARCAACGYSLVGLGRFQCPECGKEFDPKNSYSMSLGPPARLAVGEELVGRLKRPVPARVHRIPPAVAGLIAISSLMPTLFTVPLLFGTMLWLAYLLGHVPAVALKWILARRRLLPAIEFQEELRRLRRAAIYLAVSVFLFVFPVPAYVFIWWHHSTLETVIAGLGDAPVNHEIHPPLRLGPLRCTSIDRYPAEWHVVLAIFPEMDLGPTDPFVSLPTVSFVYRNVHGAWRWSVVNPLFVLPEQPPFIWRFWGL